MINLADNLDQIKLKDVMVTPVTFIYEDDELSRAEELFVEKRIFYLPVVDRNKKLVGIVTQKYLYKTHSPRRILNDEMKYNENIVIDGQSFYDKSTLDSYILNKLMFKDPATMRSDQSVDEAIRYMHQKRIGCITIIDKNRKIEGIFTAQDIIRVLAEKIS